MPAKKSPLRPPASTNAAHHDGVTNFLALSKDGRGGDSELVVPQEVSNQFLHVGPGRPRKLEHMPRVPLGGPGVLLSGWACCYPPCSRKVEGAIVKWQRPLFVDQTNLTSVGRPKYRRDFQRANSPKCQTSSMGPLSWIPRFHRCRGFGSFYPLRREGSAKNEEVYWYQQDLENISI